MLKAVGKREEVYQSTISRSTEVRAYSLEIVKISEKRRQSSLWATLEQSPITSTADLNIQKEVLCGHLR